MNTVQAAAVITLSLTAAARIVLFDTRGKTHKPLPAFIAWLTVVWLGSLAFAAAFSLYNLTCWLLIFGLALHTGAVLWSGGNISRIQPKRDAKPQKEANPCKTSISTGCEETTSAKSSSSNKAARRSTSPVTAPTCTSGRKKAAPSSSRRATASPSKTTKSPSKSRTRKPKTPNGEPRPGICN
jgi:hypothetical protein